MRNAGKYPPTPVWGKFAREEKTRERLYKFSFFARMIFGKERFYEND